VLKDGLTKSANLISDIDKRMLFYVVAMLQHLQYDLGDVPQIMQFMQTFPFVQHSRPQSVARRANEVLKTIYEMGGVLPSQVKSEYKVDNLLYADHMIEAGNGDKVIIEFEGPRHFV
jgi:hypothetical protein